MRLSKRTTCFLALQLALSSPALVSGLHGQETRQDGFVARRLEGGAAIEAGEESAANEISETFSTPAKKLQKPHQPAVSLHSYEVVEERNSGKEKKEKGKLTPHSLAPKVSKEATIAPKGQSEPTPKQKQPIYPAKKPESKSTKSPSKTPKGSEAEKDDRDYYYYYYYYYEDGDDSYEDKKGKKESETGKNNKNPKGVKGEKSYKNAAKKDKETDDRGKAPKGTKDENKDKGGKTKVPKFPGDDDDYHDDFYSGGDGGNHDGGGVIPSTPTISPGNASTDTPTEPKDGRNVDDDDQGYYDTYYDDNNGDSNGTGDEDGDQKGTDGIGTY